MWQRPLIIVLSAVLLPGACLMAVVALSGPWDSTRTWVQDGKESQQLVAPDNTLEDRLGESIAYSGGLALVGAPLADNPLSASGAAHLFSKTGEKKWTYLGKLRPNQAAVGDTFGWSVALDGSTALVGAPENQQSGKASGGAYVFQIDDKGAWKQIAKLAASDAAANDHFGHSVALSGGTAIVGSPDCDETESGATHMLQNSKLGSTYVFQKDGKGNWNEVAKLIPNDPGPYTKFGRTVAVSGQTAVVGALGDSTMARNGIAYVFSRDQLGQWREVAKLTAGDVTAGSLFGESLALHGNTLIVGACGDSSTKPFAGAAYVFRCDGRGSWCKVAKLTAADAEANDSFGHSVALSGDNAIIGAVGRHESAGAVYAFHADSAGNWKPMGTYAAKDAREFDLLGSSVAIIGETVLAGAPQHNATASKSGSAYVIRIGVPQ